MACKGLCLRIKAKRHPKDGWYEHNSRCTHCAVFIKFVGSNCPCCGFRLRYKARNKHNQRN